MTDVDGVGKVVVFYVKRVEYPVKDAVDDDSTWIGILLVPYNP